MLGHSNRRSPLNTAGLPDDNAPPPIELLPDTSTKACHVEVVTCERCVQRSIVNCRRRTVSIPQRFESDRTPSRVEDRLAKDPPTSKGSLVSDLRFAIHVCHSPQCGRRSRRVGDTAASPGGLSGLQTLFANETANEERALEKIDRQANEMPLD